MARHTAPRARRPASTVNRRAVADTRTAHYGANRPLIILALIAIASSALFARLVFWQVMQHNTLVARAAAQRSALLVAPPARGNIYDANGAPLATNITANMVYAIPHKVRDWTRTARLLSPILNLPQKRMLDFFSTDSGYPILLAAQVTSQVSDQIQALGLPGILLGPQVRRTYPQGSLASQLLGYANHDNKGNYGVEGYYDAQLSGVAGVRSVVKDTAGNNVQVNGATPAPSHNGADIYLTIDSSVQGLAEDELHKAVKAHNADGGTVIVMDPRTGHILGMANSPTYNPNHYWRSDPARFINPAAQWTYEPGSTFKVITMAAALDSRLITPDTSFYDGGIFRVANVAIHNWNMSGFGQETMTQVLQHSANVGASWVAQRLGVSRFYDYIRRFKLGQPTGLDVQAEEPGILPRPGQKAWTIVNLYTNSFGQGLAVTPIQMIQAIGAVANGGVMMTPQVTQKLSFAGRIIDRPPLLAGRVISSQAARTLTNMLVHSAINGEASAALVKGYDIAAKTGTANIADGHGRYQANTTIASVVGYAPAYSPRFAVLVIIRHPRDTPWGSTVAAPVMHNLFQELFLRYRIPPSPHAINK